ncbi:MAG: 16S rRNA (uracil(1498)-N(3))-methyltransferase [Cyclobacteriaceae bacterium]
MQLFYQPLIQDGALHLEEDEARHAIKVLRLKVGDAIQLTDGKGNIFRASIDKIDKTTCSFSVKETITIPKRKFSVHIGIAPTKNIDRIEWFVEKATEIGVDEISFIRCQNSERRVVNLDRIYKKAISAMKQSGQAWLPKLNPIAPFEECLKADGKKYIAFVDSRNPAHLKDVQTGNRSTVLIGPEGDFTTEELELAIKNGFQKVSLGSPTLRTETAGLAACHILNLINA